MSIYYNKRDIFKEVFIILKKYIFDWGKHNEKIIKFLFKFEEKISKKKNIIWLYEK